MARRIRKIPVEAHFRAGDIVTVYNKTLSGKPVVEGTATIIGPSGIVDQYRVRFRFVYPGECQSDPEAYFAKAQAQHEASQRAANAGR